MSTTINETQLQDCTWKQFVAFNPATNKFVPAAAYWTVDANDGSVRPAASAYIVGVVTTVPDASGTAAIMTEGVLGADYVNIEDNGPGDYYLHTDGKAVLGVPEGMLPVYCGTLTASGNFIVRPSAPEFRGHRHTNRQLNNALFSNDSGSYVYDTTGTDTVTANILAAVPSIALSVIKNGVMLEYGEDYTINTDGKLVLDHNPSTASIVICTINPLIATDSEVRSIVPTAGNNILRVEKAYGTVYLDTVFPETLSNGVYTGHCVTGLSRSGIAYADVVHHLTPGAGINLVQQTAGSYIINNSYISSTLIDFQTLNANNVLIGNTVTDPLITFPVGLSSSVICIARVPQADTAWTIQVFMWAKDTSAAAVGSLVGAVRCQSVDDTEGSDIVTTPVEVNFNGVSGAADGKVYKIVSTTTISNVAPNSLVSVSLSTTNPAAAIKLMAAGIELV